MSDRNKYPASQDDDGRAPRAAAILIGALLAVSILLGSVQAAHAGPTRPSALSGNPARLEQTAQRLPRTWRIAVPDRRHIQYTPAGRTARRTAR